MDKESLKRKVLSDMNTKENMIADLQRELKEEMNKPSSQWDCEKISEITETIHNLSCDSKIEVNETRKEDLLKKVKSSKNPKRKIYRSIGAVAACLLIGVGINAASLSVFGTNMFSVAYQIFNGGITIDMDKEDAVEIPTTDDDPYGMKAKCAEYDMYPLTPTYIPECFELTDITDIESSSFNNLIFYFKNREIKLNFDFCQYNEGEEIPPIGIPTDTYNIVEEEVNGHKMYILKEDNQFTATFQEDNMVYMIFADGLDYDNCQKVIESLADSTN